MNYSFKALALIAACCCLSPEPGQSQATLFSDSFDTDTSASWDVFPGSASGTPDYQVLFGFDYSTNRFTRNGVTATIPPAPNGGGKGVKMWVNKADATGEAAAVSLFPKGKIFSGQYALKFDMWLNYNGGAGGGSGSTEFATFGINHMGDKVIWDSTGPSDGLWFAVSGEGGAAGDYRVYYGDGFNPPLRAQASTALLDRDGDGVYEDEIVDGTHPLEFPLAVMFPAPQFETAGMPGKEWVRVEIRQRTNEFGMHTVTWLINDYVIGEHMAGDSFGMTSGNIMLGNMDIYASIADPKEDNYVIYDNVRVVDLSAVPPLPVLTLTPDDSVAAEPANTASVTITRFGDLSAPLTVYYRTFGTAKSGLDYEALPGVLTLAVGQAGTNLTITPLNDLIGETTETIIVALSGSANYDIYTNFSAVITLEDDGDTATATVMTLKTNAYEANPDRDGRFEIRLSNPSSSPITVAFTLTGTAVAGTDFTAVGNSVTIPAGETNAIVRIKPINDDILKPERSITLALSSGAGYVLGAVTNGMVTIRDDDFVPAGNLVYSEDFEADPAANWRVNPSPGENPVDLFFDYSSVGIPAAPHSAPGGIHGAKLQANLSGGVFGGVSISPMTLNLTNDYVLRFDLWQSFNGPAPDGGSGSTQLTGAGVGTEGLTPLWPGGTQQGIWFAATGDGGTSADYRAYSSAAPTGYADASGVFTAGGRNNTDAYYYEFGQNAPPQAQRDIFPSQSGVTLVGAPAFVWRDVVIQKTGTTVTWHLDGKLLATVKANATNFAGGNIVLLQSDINTSSSSDPNAAAIAFGLFDNVRVYQLAPNPATPPRITAISVNGGMAQIDFSGEIQDTAGSFKLQSSDIASGPYADAVAAAITQLSPGKFRAGIEISGGRQFYRVRR